MKFPDISPPQGLFFLLVSLAMVSSGAAFSCYQCNSTLDHNCQERFNPNSRVADNFRQQCDMWAAQYCVKVTGLWGGVVGTHRFCSSRDLGYQCQDIWFPDHDRNYRACVYTCNNEDCNAASRTSVTAVALVLCGWTLYHLQQLLAL